MAGAELVSPARARVAIFVPSLQGGGAERMMVRLANGFADKGIAIDLVVARAEGPCLDEVSPQVRVVDLGRTRVLASVLALVCYLRRERPLGMLSALNHANVVAILARWIARTPTRLVVSERATLSLMQQTAQSLRSRLMPTLMRLTYPRADAIVAVSKGVADDLAHSIGLPRAKVRVIYNPVVTQALLASSRDRPVHPWFAEGAPPVVLAAGRLEAEKDFECLIRAFSLLHGARAARLMIVGEGSQRSALERLVTELGLSADVELPGFIAEPYPYMGHAALFVLSSRTEGLPGALIEAMACGTPVVSTDCPSGPAEILENGRWGRLVPVGDFETLAVAMAATLDGQEHPSVEHRALDFGVDRAVAGYLEALGVDPCTAAGGVSPANRGECAETSTMTAAGR